MTQPPLDSSVCACLLACFTGNANKEAGEATRLQPVAQLGPTARQIAGIDPWPETEGNGEAFSGMTAEWTPEVAARL